jgi:diguanylate cyclase
MTTKSESHTRTLPFAKYAIEQIERFGLPAEPKSFELWYRYAAGHDSLLNQAVNDVISSPAGLTEADFDRLCASHGSSERAGSRLSAAATDLSGEITQVIGMIVAAAVSSEKYDRHLGDGLIGFKQTESYEALKPVVEALSSPPEKWKARPERSKCSWRNRKRGPPVCSTK